MVLVRSIRWYIIIILEAFSYLYTHIQRKGEQEFLGNPKLPKSGYTELICMSDPTNGGIDFN